MPSDNRKYITSLQLNAAEARTLFSNSQKPKRERMIVGAFLRCIGVPFSGDQIQTSTEEPVDVIFRQARFQVMVILGGRKPGKEWREREKRYQTAEPLSDFLEPWTSSVPMTFDEVARNVAESLCDKASHYGVINCSKLDALVYLDLSGRHLWPLDAALETEAADELIRQAWRSVSVVFLPYGVVLTAKADAPPWLKEKRMRVLKKWRGPDGWFDV
jgi:hypothetical protein